MTPEGHPGLRTFWWLQILMWGVRMRAIGSLHLIGSLVMTDDMDGSTDATMLSPLICHRQALTILFAGLGRGAAAPIC